VDNSELVTKIFAINTVSRDVKRKFNAHELRSAKPSFDLPLSGE
jgi:hypothetical protein